MKLSEYAIKHPAVITISLIALVLGSSIAVSGLKQQLFASVDLPQAIVITTYPGGTPEDIERDITNPLEDELSKLSSVTEITSTSADSISTIFISFTMDTVISDKLVDIREMINNASGELPDDISGEPQIFKMSSSSLSAFTTVIESELPLVEVTKYIEEQVIPRLSRISGVAQATLNGGVEKEVKIVLDLDKLMARSVSVLEVVDMLQYNNVSLPAGTVSLKGQNMNIRTAGRFETIEEIEQLVVGYQDGAPITLLDVCSSIDFEHSDRFIVPISNGQEIMSLGFDLVQNADTPGTISKIKDELNKIEEEQNNLINFSVLSDDSETIELSLKSVLNSAIMGGILAVIILFLFLHNVRTTTIIGLSIPFSLLLALSAMKLLGMTLNIMTLAGLTIAIGMIVDASIVILENIFHHYKTNGDREKAALLGANEMGGAVIASTMTSLAVFVPLLFLSGMIGEILRDISLTMAFSLIGSLLVAIIVVPYLSAHLLKKNPENNKIQNLDKIFSFIEKFLNWLTKEYKLLLKKALENRLFVIVFALVLMVMSIMMTRFIGFEFVPSTDMNEIIISCEFPQGYSLEESKQKSELLEQELLRLVPEVESSVFFVGQSGFLNLGAGYPNKSFAVIRLEKVSKRKRKVQELINMLQLELPKLIPDMNITVKNGGLSKLMDATTGGSGFIIDIYGTDLDELLLAAELVENAMKQDPNIIKTDSNVRINRRKIEIDLDHRLMGNLGVTPYAAGITNRVIFNGYESGTLETDSESYTIFVTTDYAGEVINEDILNRISVRNSMGNLIPARSFSSLSEQPAISSIEHKDGIITIKVSGQLIDSNVRDTEYRVTSLLNESDFPSGIEWEIGGSAAEMKDAFKNLMVIMVIAIFLVYMVMVIQFEKFTQPLIVMASVPFTLIGVILSLLIFNSTLNIVSLLGMIALSGIVVNNAIVLIDYTNLLRSRGISMQEAIIQGASSRLKPILMTTMTTVLGIFPIALGLGEGGEMLSSLGQAIVGGLLTSTLITMVLIPVIYSLVESKNSKKESE